MNPESPVGPMPAPQRSWRARWIIIAAGVVAVAVTIAIVASVTGGPDEFALRGHLTLIDGDIEHDGHGDCFGTGGYRDMRQGASVTVYDPAGAVLATGNVDDTQYMDSAACELRFAVDGVPAGHEHYQVEVSHRGKVAVTVDKARTGVELSLD